MPKPVLHTTDNCKKYFAERVDKQIAILHDEIVNLS